jgi:hypothetical protein
MFEARVAEARALLSIANEHSQELPTSPSDAFGAPFGDWILSDFAQLKTSMTLPASTRIVYTANIEMRSTTLWQAFWSDLPIWYGAVSATRWLTVDQQRPTLSSIEEASLIEQLAWAA